MVGGSILAESGLSGRGERSGMFVVFKELQAEEFDMKMDGQERIAPKVPVSARLGIGSWTILVALFLLLAVTFMVVYLGWTLGNGADVPASGYVAMALG